MKMTAAVVVVVFFCEHRNRQVDTDYSFKLNVGVVLDKRNYDTHGVSSSGYQMRDYLNSINGE